ncbi:MAG: VWA domain-containing protein [Acidobacteriota bacterium]
MAKLNRGRAVCALLLVALAERAAERPATADDAGSPAFTIDHAEWLQEVDVILSSAEHDAFLALTRGYQRDAFIERFWQEHDEPALAPGEAFREHWQDKVAQARELFGNLTDARARYFLLHGPADPRTLVYCRRREAQIELWFYPRGSDSERTPFPLLFYRPYGSTADFRLWEPGDEDELYGACEPDSLGIDDQAALHEAFSLKSQSWTDTHYLELLARGRDRQPRPNQEWVTAFENRSTDLPPRADLLPAALTIRVGGRRQSRRVVEGTVAIEAEPGPATRHFLLNGEVVADDRLLETFRVQYLPPAQPGSTPLAFVRTLPPGHYNLVVRIEEPGPGRFFRAEQDFDVPAFSSIEPTETAASSHLEVPDEVPRAHRIAAAALDARGDEVSRDEHWVNAGDYRFAVRLIEPRPGTAPPAGAPVRVRAEVDIPAGAALGRLEIYLDEALVETLYGEPWELPLALAEDPRPHLLRVSAVLTDGGAAEDSVLIDAPTAAATVDVRAVEVFARVHSRATREAPSGDAVHGLGCSDFRLRESGIEQTLLRCEEAVEGMIHLGLLLDTSASVAERLDVEKAAADRFLAALLRPRDRATVVSFNRSTHRLVPFTGDLGALRSGIENLKAEPGSALWDALIQTLRDFSGVEGRRALILLSAGDDRAPSSTYAEARATLRQSGVQLYSVGLDLSSGASRRRLRRLSRESGGRAFFVRDAMELGGVFSEIADDLREQYLLAYQPRLAGDKFRPLRVSARRHGFVVEAPAGYQP